jgi:hypothetical protein
VKAGLATAAGAEIEGSVELHHVRSISYSAPAWNGAAWNAPSFPRCVSLRRHSAEPGKITALPRSARQSMEDREMRNGQETFDAQAEVNRIRSLRAEARRKLFRKSRLDRYRAELVAMKQAGASCADLVVWLRITHRCKINRSSVDRYLKKLPELQDDLRSNEGKENSF